MADTNKFDVYDPKNVVVDHTEKSNDDGTTDVTIANLPANTVFSGYGATYAGNDPNTGKGAFPDFTTAPSKPTIALTAGDKTLTINATLAKGDGSEPIAKAVATITPDGGQATTKEFDKPDITKMVVDGLTNDTEYTISVVLSSANGDSDASDGVKATPKASISLPGSPTIKATAGDGKISFSLTAPSNDGNSDNNQNDLTAYNIYVKSRSDNWPDKPTQTLNPDQLNGEIDNLTNGTEYTVAATAVNAAGESDLNATGASDHATPQAATVAVTGVTADKTLSVAIGKTSKITASVQPDDATDKAVTFASADETVATVDADGTVHGVKATDSGKTVAITVTAHGDSTKTATTAVTVTAA